MNNNKQQPKPENTNNQFSNTGPLTHAQRVAIANTMSNYKQSSVEKLAELIRFTNKEVYAELFEEIEQAKAMHKEEHHNTYNQGLMSNFQNFEQYYNETFGGNNEQ